MMGIDKRKWLFLFNRGMLALVALLVVCVLLYAPWRSELLREIQMVFINARLL